MQLCLIGCYHEEMCKLFDQIINNFLTIFNAVYIIYNSTDKEYRRDMLLCYKYFLIFTLLLQTTVNSLLGLVKDRNYFLEEVVVTMVIVKNILPCFLIFFSNVI